MALVLKTRQRRSEISENRGSTQSGAETPHRNMRQSQRDFDLGLHVTSADEAALPAIEQQMKCGL